MTLSAEVPDRYPVALNAVPFLIDNDRLGEWRHETIPPIREQADTSDTPGEQTTSREGLWRRSQDTWHRGAGQTYLDRSDSDPARFRSSKGLNPWDRWKLTLLNDTARRVTSSNTNLFMAVAGSRMFVTDGTAVRYSDDATTFTAMTGTTASWTSITSDGYTTYVTDGSNIYSWVRTATAVGAAWSTFDSDVLGYVKGRLMSAHDNVVSNITAAAVKNDVLTHPNTDWRCVGFAAGRNSIYFAGYSGDKSLIYATDVPPEGISLSPAVVVGELPDGEIVRAIHAYLGFVVIGTDRGVRFAVADGNGNLEIGALIETSSAVRCFEGQGRWVWFGWTNYDGTSTGLGRLDLTELNGSAPAYASDLMAGAQGNVLSAVTFANKRVFTVSASGVWGETGSAVASGTIDTGLITYGIADDKAAIYTDVRHAALGTSVAASLSLNGGAFASIGTSSTAGATGDTFTISEKRGETLELRFTITNAELRRWTMRVMPIMNAGSKITVPLLLNNRDLLANGITVDRDPDGLRAAIDELHFDGTPVHYQEGTWTFWVTVDGYMWIPHDANERHNRAGTLIASLKTIEVVS